MRSTLVAITVFQEVTHRGVEEERRSISIAQDEPSSPSALRGRRRASSAKLYFLAQWCCKAVHSDFQIGQTGRVAERVEDHQHVAGGERDFMLEGVGPDLCGHRAIGDMAGTPSRHGPKPPRGREPFDDARVEMLVIDDLEEEIVPQYFGYVSLAEAAECRCCEDPGAVLGR